MQQNHNQRSIPMSSIVEFDNPRKRANFDPVKLAELTESVRTDGVLQSVLVRSLGLNDAGVELYALIAGERRYTAGNTVGLEFIPAIVIEATKAQAAALAVVENTIRDDMSATEEATAAANLMAVHHNDKAEVLRHLCWSPTKLEQRLALMRCAPEVRDALDQRLIQLGHAELLAALPVEKQVSSLPKIIENKLTVAYVKQNLAKVAQSLPKAFFDQTDCLSCQYNTACQTGLFAETIDEGFCTNSPCYERKTIAALNTMKDELVNDYPVVRIISLGDANTSLPLQATGVVGVGLEQAKACRACENFGCTISGLPESTGKVERDLCFDAVCNASKVVAFIRSSKPKAEPQSKAADSSKAASKGTTKGAAKGGKASTKKKAVVQTPTKVKEYRVTLWRDIARKELLQRGDDALTVLVALGIVGSSRHISSSKMGEAYGKLTGGAASSSSYDLAGVLNMVRDNSPAKTRLLEALSASAMANVEERQLVATLQFLRIDMRAHWTPCAEFLNLLTKSEIEVVAEELGLKAALGDKFAKIVGGKKDALVKALLSVEGFDYSDAVPDVLVYGALDEVVVSSVHDENEDEAQNEGGSDDAPVESSSELEMAETN